MRFVNLRNFIKPFHFTSPQCRKRKKFHRPRIEKNLHPLAAYIANSATNWKRSIRRSLITRHLIYMNTYFFLMQSLNPPKYILQTETGRSSATAAGKSTNLFNKNPSGRNNDGWQADESAAASEPDRRCMRGCYTTCAIFTSVVSRREKNIRYESRFARMSSSFLQRGPGLCIALQTGILKRFFPLYILHFSIYEFL